MRTMNVVFEDEEFDRLTKAKGELNWHDFVLTLAERKKGL